MPDAMHRWTLTFYGLIEQLITPNLSESAKSPASVCWGWLLMLCLFHAFTVGKILRLPGDSFHEVRLQGASFRQVGGSRSTHEPKYVYM